MTHYYRNDMYSTDKGQYAKHDGDKVTFIMKETDGTMSKSVEPYKGEDEFTEAWFEVSQPEWDQIEGEYEEYIKTKAQ